VERNAALESQIQQLQEQLHEAQQHAAEVASVNSPGGRREIRTMPSRTDTARSFFQGEADHSPERELQAARRAEAESLEDRIHEKEHELQEARDECDELRRNCDRLQRERERLRQEHEQALHHLQEELHLATQSATSRQSPRRPTDSQPSPRARSSGAPCEASLERSAADEEEEHPSADGSEIDSPKSKLEALHIKNRQLEEDLRQEARRSADALVQLQARDETLRKVQAEHEELLRMLEEAREVKSKPGRSFMPRFSMKSTASTNNLGHSMYAATMRGSPDDWDHRRSISSEASEQHSKDVAGFEIEAPPHQQAMQAQPAGGAGRSELLLDVPCYCCRMVLMRPGSSLGRPLL